MKRLLALILSIVTVLSLAACGSKTQNNTQTGAQTGAQTGTQVTDPQPTNPGPDSTATEPKLDYPKYAITINGSTTGSTVDINARSFAKVLAKYVPVNVVVNSTSGQVDSFRSTMNAAPDGYTLCWSTVNVTISDVKGKTDFDSVNASTFIACTVKGGGHWLCCKSDFAKKNNINSFSDLIAYTKAHPQELVVSTSAGMVTDVACKQFISAGMDAYPVSIEDAGKRVVALLGGDIDLYIGGYAAIKQYIETGEVMCLCYLGHERSPFSPDIPCTTELGYDLNDAASIYNLSCPKDTPKEIVAYLEEATRKTVEDPEYVEALLNNSSVAYFAGSEETYKIMSEYKQLMIDAGFGG